MLVIELGAMPGEAYGPACSPLAGRGWWKRMKEEKQGRDQKDGSGRPGEAVRAPAQGLRCVQGWALTAGLTPGPRQGPDVQKSADIMVFRESCFKNSEGFFIYYSASAMNGQPSVCKLVQIPRMHHFKVLHFSGKTLHVQ